MIDYPPKFDNTFDKVLNMNKFYSFILHQHRGSFLLLGDTMEFRFVISDHMASDFILPFV